MKVKTAALFFTYGASAQQSLWGQCGGLNWSGPTTCASGNYCKYINDWYSQCLPGGPSVTTQAPSTTTTTTQQPPSPTTSQSPPTTTTGGGQPTSCPSIPSELGSGASSLNDPFTFLGGSKVMSKALWECRHNEILELMQKIRTWVQTCSAVFYVRFIQRQYPEHRHLRQWQEYFLFS